MLPVCDLRCSKRTRLKDLTREYLNFKGPKRHDVVKENGDSFFSVSHLFKINLNRKHLKDFHKDRPGMKVLSAKMNIMRNISAVLKEMTRY
jgi:hypothetical protein